MAIFLGSLAKYFFPDLTWVCFEFNLETFPTQNTWEYISSIRQFSREIPHHLHIRAFGYAIMPCRQSSSCANCFMVPACYKNCAYQNWDDHLKMSVLGEGQGKVCQKFVLTKHPCFKSSLEVRGCERAIPEIPPLISACRQGGRG